MNLRRVILFGTVISLLMAASGCTHYKPEFDQAYLPNSVPGSPQKRIDLPKYVTDKASVKKWSLFGKSTTYLPASLYWVEEDNLLFNIMSEGNKSLLYSFLIIPSTSEIKLLEGAEKYVLLGEIDKNTSLVSTETTGSQIAKALAGLASFAMMVAARGGGSGPNFSKNYKGKIQNNGTALDFDISIKKVGRGWAFSTSTGYELAYVAENNRTGNTLKGKRRFAISNDDYRINKDIEEHESRKWLKSWRVSPDGRYYVIGGSATFVDPEEEYSAFTNLIENYDRVYAGFDVNPRWDKIALLNIKEDEKTKQMNYRIEFYPFEYKNKKMTKQHQRQNAGCCFFFLQGLYGRNIAKDIINMD